MSENVLKYQCTACGGSVHFEPNSQMIVCDYCDTKYPENYFDNKKEIDTNDDGTINEKINDNDKIDWRTAGFVTERDVVEGQVGYICTSCGAEILSDGSTAATECLYCSNPVVLSDNVSGMLKPDFVIPFKLDKKAAQKQLKNFYNKKVLLPNAFKSKNRISKITGMYVPFWLFSAKGDGWVVFDAQKSSSRRSGDYIVTTTDHYKAEREGSLEFIKIPVDASLKMEDNYMDGLEPYNYSELKEFSSVYMSGFLADKFDVDVENCSKRVIARVKNSTVEKMKSTVIGYSKTVTRASNINMQTNDIRYVMLPVWILNTEYKGKFYHFAVNGQTGKVSGDLPISKIKQSVWFFLVTAVSFMIFSQFGRLLVSSMSGG